MICSKLNQQEEQATQNLFKFEFRALDFYVAVLG